ncbi:LysR substrate-binding domain-containing protein [Bradyrhizobium sp. Arg237L]|uniref:LysR substrate-binding domain-containing protein n=1 Tax=Bradyrhizobium sp. Arg237L TaxID=3003352 RepID=UPI00249DD228|nr:LysR substrate-binding domain-containing protein [Bradyrhizobium sp. Arg237L]MDI4232569.1 LysR substrate-binding domain-containing protein [Bradyrhizobium sp. Arg237L]
MRNLDLDLLRTFVAIADAESFAAAAQRVHRTQSAVSQQMQRLESHVGKLLMVKQGRTKRLTDDGMKLLDYARRIISLNDEANAALATRPGQTEVVRLGASNDMAENILPIMLGRIAKSHPNVLLEVRTGRSPFLMEELKKGELDLAITTRLDPNLPRIALRSSPTVWLCAADYQFERKKQLPLILSNEPSLFRALAIDALDRAHLSWRIAYLSLNLLAIRAAVRAGLGITARNIEMLTPDLRVLGEADGLPRLPDVTFYLYMRDESVDEAAQQVFETFRGMAF